MAGKAKQKKQDDEAREGKEKKANPFQAWLDKKAAKKKGKGKKG